MKSTRANKNSRNSMALFLLLVILTPLLLQGCETTFNAKQDFDAGHVFTGYRSYAWISDRPMIVASANRVNPLLERRVMAAVENRLSRQGFELAKDVASADFTVGFTVGARDKISVSSYPSGYHGSWRWGYNYWHENVVVNNYTEGTLAIDVFDVKKKQPVWHGYTSKRLTQAMRDQPAETIKKAVDAILEGFPPK